MTGPQFCIYCKHRTGEQVCKAFPEGIPDQVFWGNDPHTVPMDGDNGIIFEPEEKFKEFFE